ncbi:MAG: hypothetical protein AAF194_09515 [Pseudomonadota bacterium]
MFQDSRLRTVPHQERENRPINTGGLVFRAANPIDPGCGMFITYGSTSCTGKKCSPKKRMEREVGRIPPLSASRIYAHQRIHCSQRGPKTPAAAAEELFSVGPTTPAELRFRSANDLQKLGLRAE